MDTLTIESLSRQFARIGARLAVDEKTPIAEAYTLDVRSAAGRHSKGSKGETFVLRVREDVRESLDLLTLDVRAGQRHLLLFARPLARGEASGVREVTVPTTRFLCGHDERHWFVAAVGGAASSVSEAMEGLKPRGVAAMQRRLGVRARDWNRRKNPAFLRQGEWFFLPQPGWQPPSAALTVLRNEAIRRGDGSKPHLVEELYRDGGELVYVCPRHPNGVTPAQQAKILARDPAARAWGWQPLRRNMQVFARGRVRHADHATITLPCWHRVLMNGEELSRNVAFLD
ncbi:MAG TPA: hypothetical protein VM490_00435 [Armatimonadaceae bacterium]|nr:hypothetical protein [Armatimonadaceae bacterium]